MTQIVPTISVLQADAIAEVHARSLEILATVGVRVGIGEGPRPSPPEGPD